MKDIEPIKNELEDQVERGSLFTHSVLSKQSARLNEIESFLFGIIEVMTQKGITPADEFKQVVEVVRQEMITNNEMTHPGLALRIDDENTSKNATVNCDERLHICKAVCCKLKFPLNAEEVESGKIKWDLGRPYMIRQKKDCFCTHNNTTNKKCSIYNDRPSFCKRYDCTNDTRIWKDFDKMELNNEWILENIKETKLRFVRAPMFTDEQITNTYNPTENVDNKDD